MIASLLIVRAAVRGPKVERVVRRDVVRQSEGDTDEATSLAAWWRRTGDLRFNDAVGEVESLNGGKLREPSLFLHRPDFVEAAQGFFGMPDPHAFLALQHGGLGDYIVQPEAGRRV